MNKIKILLLGALFVLFSCTSPDTISFPFNSVDDLTNSEVSFLKNGAKSISRSSAVRVRVKDRSGDVAAGSGTFFKLKGHSIVITAAHLFRNGQGELFASEGTIISPQEKVIGTLVYFDSGRDLAIFAVPHLESRTPASFSRSKRYKVGTEVVYTGFPGSNNLLTFIGILSGRGYAGTLAMQSFAWGGSSGSGVFDARGDFVGVLVSIMIGRAYPHSQLVPDVVYLAPALGIDKKELIANLELLKDSRNEGF